MKGKMEEIIPEHIISKLKEIIKLKKESRENQIIQNDVKIDNYIESFLKDDSEAPKEKQLSTINILDEELKRIVFRQKSKGKVNYYR